MLGSSRSIVVPALLALLSGGAWSGAWAGEGALKAPTVQDLAALKAMRYAGPMPELTGFNAARAVKSERLKGGKDYSVAYQSQAGCVVFFSPLAKGEHDLGLIWDGPKCDGRPIRGEGLLAISYKVDAADGTHVPVFVFRGRFENGMLTGQGAKTNFSFGPDGRLKPSIFDFSGSFAGGLLDGLGKKTWTGPADGVPSAQVQEGQFSEGTPHGEIVFSQLHPYPGVEAETKTLVFDANGRPLLEQPDSKGALFLTGDSAGWSTVVQTLRSDWRVSRAFLFRDPSRFGGYDQSAGCLEWDFRPDGLRCQEGVLAWTPTGSAHHLRLQGRPFMIPLNRKTRSPFRVSEQEVLTLGSAVSEEESLTCSADLSACRGKAILELGYRISFSGEVEYQDGEVRPVSGAFRMGPASILKGTPLTKELLARCEAFRSPTRCRSGWLRLSAEESWTGGFELAGLEFEAKQGYKAGHAPFRFAMEGEGRYRWKEGGRWADVRTDEDRIVSVGRCGHDGMSGDFTCSLDDRGTVVFKRQ